jgi:hypothetical protein
MDSASTRWSRRRTSGPRSEHSISCQLAIQLEREHPETYVTVYVVPVGGLTKLHPVELHSDVALEKAALSSVLDAMGIANCVDTRERKQSWQ